MSAGPTVSVVIAHQLQRGALLDRCLQSLLDQGQGEILIECEGNVSETRNRAALRSKGDFLVFLDDDAVVRPGSLEELLSPFHDPQVGLVGGVNISFSNLPLRERVSSGILASRFTMFRSAARHTPTGDVRLSDEAEVSSCFMAVRRLAFLQAGGFPEGLVPCEENVLVNRIQRAGWRVVYNPFAVVYHERAPIFLPFWRKSFHYGTGRGLMIRRGEEKPKMLFKPRLSWLLYPIATAGHYIAYVLGVLRGFLA